MITLKNGRFATGQRPGKKQQPGRKRRGTLLLPAGQESVLKAALVLSRGGLVAFPTETVYGLGASVVQPRAINRLFEVKGRPADNPLRVHISDREPLDRVVSSVPPAAERRMSRFWPGPLTLVLPRLPSLPPEISAGLPTVAVRMPAHSLARELIRATGAPVVAPSANLSGRPSPTTARHVLADLAGKIDVVLDGGPCRVGVESTVLDLTGNRPTILRPGGVPQEKLEQVLGVAVNRARWKGEEIPPSPGMKYRHYSPKGSLLLIIGPPGRRRRAIKTLARYYLNRGLSVGLLNPVVNRSQLRETTPGKEELARCLYDRLRRYDQLGIKVVLAEEILPEGIGEAIMNRLRKAAVRVIKV